MQMPHSGRKIKHREGTRARAPRNNVPAAGERRMPCFEKLYKNLSRDERNSAEIETVQKYI